MNNHLSFCHPSSFTPSLRCLPYPPRKVFWAIRRSVMGNPGIVLRVEASGVLTGSDSFDDLSVGLSFRDLSLGHLLDGLEVGNLRLGE